MTNYKLIATIFLISTKLCFGQDQFRKELPYDEFQLDTPFIVKHFEDFQIIHYGIDSIKEELYYSCKVNKEGNELICTQTKVGDSSSNYISISFYNPDGKLHSVKSYHTGWEEYFVSILTYDTKGQKIKTEMFKYSQHRDLRPGTFPDTLENIVFGDSINMKKFEDDNNFNIYKSWQQSGIWTWQYDDKGRVVEFNTNDQLNQKFKCKTQYDDKGRINKELGYRNYDPNDKARELTDSLTVITDYIYLSNGFVRTIKKWDYYIYTFIDTFIVNSKNQVLKKISWWQYTDNAKPRADEISLTQIEIVTFEYDNYGRKTKKTTEFDKFKDCEVYRYRNSGVHDLKQEVN
ncbi:MAG: hypothetical protein IPP27_12820 [Bacteroidetes bacterium]|nr:hypothetical protein [Bacteroidota bacterium]